MIHCPLLYQALAHDTIQLHHYMPNNYTFGTNSHHCWPTFRRFSFLCQLLGFDLEECQEFPPFQDQNELDKDLPMYKSKKSKVLKQINSRGRDVILPKTWKAISALRSQALLASAAKDKLIVQWKVRYPLFIS